MTGHEHAALMAQYAQDAAETDKPWERWECDGGCLVWTACIGPLLWMPETRYRRKAKTININGHEVPEPLRVAPPVGDAYYVTSTEGSFWSVWNGCHHDQRRLSSGLVHATHEAAEIHRKALLSFTEVRDE